MRTYLRVIISAVLIVVIVGGGLGIGVFLAMLGKEPPRKEQTALPPLVESFVLRAGPVVERYMGYGTARADRTAMLAAEVAGTVLERLEDIEAGSHIKDGQALVRLDDRQYQQDMERALALVAADQAQLEEIEVEVDNLGKLKSTAERELMIAADEKARVSGLFESGQAAKREYDLANLAYQQARRAVQNYEKELAVLGPRAKRAEASRRANEAAVRIAMLNVERCRIIAPFAGMVDRILVEKGDRVGPGTPVISLVDSSHLEIAVFLPASVYHQVRLNAPCQLQTESTQEGNWHGEVARIAPVAAEQTRTFACYIEVDNTIQKTPLVPGTFVTAVVEGLSHDSALIVPRDAVRRGYLLVEEDRKARRRDVTIKRFIFDQVLVDGDIRDGDRVILSHLDLLGDGSPVRIVEPKKATEYTAATPSGDRQEASP